MTEKFIKLSAKTNTAEVLWIPAVAVPLPQEEGLAMEWAEASADEDLPF